ncbi:MAG TPA: hypothetical protein P5518_05770 [Candidatus Cloacimonas sp.]|jgi:hypothetical protein|nr:hypothetical protein [Candidatus Cloacimonas sp.]MDD2250827.1 hypothetical protein [Candidatus Cloacimonadota bacterium]MCK9165103.1 hypothetical protein [Candidatus Cloacimonas sp.]MDD3734064.1 hypothetical protein [Candidatus Cloacimonadota bacterium]MDD4677358.1 hypothetical protein [Candidatus Cloacimonadota bacterium]
MKAINKILLAVALCLLMEIVAAPIKAQSFDIQAFSDTTKYGWKNYLDRNAYREDLKQRQELLQIYEMEAQPLNTNILKSALIPGWGQFSTKESTKGTVILGAEIVLAGGAYYFMDRAMSKYRLYEKATQVDDIEKYYKDAQVPYQYSFIMIGFAGIIWAYNIFDVIQSTQDYNVRLWEEIIERTQRGPVNITPTGVEVRF